MNAEEVEYMPNVLQRYSRLIIVFIILCALVYQGTRNTLFRDDYTGDEGFYGTLALNMTRDPAYLLRPAPEPDGIFDTVNTPLAHPPVNSYLMAGAYLLFGHRLEAFEIVPFVSFLLTLLGIYLLVALWNQEAALLSVLLLAVSPAILKNFRYLEAEPIMAALGIASIYFSALSARRHRVVYALVAGGCLGFAFVTKLWLVFPYGFAAAGALCFGYGWRKMWKPLIVFGMAFLLCASTHLAAIALWVPDDLDFWVRRIYLAPFFGVGIAGSKLSATAANIPSNWVHPWWYYASIAYRDHFFLFPMIALGIPAVRRDDWRMLAWIGPGLASGILLSLFAIKETLYALPIWLFLYPCAGVCLTAWLNDVQANSRRLTWYPAAIVLGMAIAVIAVIFAYSKGIAPDSITQSYMLLHTVVMLLLVVTILVGYSVIHADTLSFVLAGAALSFAVTAVGDIVSRQPVAPLLQQVVAPYVKDASRSRPAFIAPNYKALQLYLFQNGKYWKDAPIELPPERFVQAESENGVRVYVVGPQEQQQYKPLITYLEKHSLELTDQYDTLLGRKGDLRIFAIPKQ